MRIRATWRRTTCLADAENAKVDRYVFLGDLVGYGADPNWVVDRVAGMVEAGAVIVRGNHDAAVADPSEGMVAEAQAAIRWTQSRLDDPQKIFLANLPLAVEEDDRLSTPVPALQIPGSTFSVRARLSRASWPRTVD